MVVIRLTRVGKKNSPAYRVVIADKRRAVKRKFIEIIGHYNPMVEPKELVISKERALFWMQNGAQPSDTVRNMMVRLGILAEDQKATKIYGKEMGKKAAKEAAANPPKAVEPSAEAAIEEVAEEPAESDDLEAAAEAEVSADEATEAAEEKVEDTAEEVEAKEEESTDKE